MTCDGTEAGGDRTVLSYHGGDASVCDADSDFGFLRPSLRVGHTDDVCVVGGLNVTHRACDGHVHFIHVGAVRWQSEWTTDKAINRQIQLN